MEKQALTTGEVAEWCSVNLRTVLRWIQRGDIKAFRLPGSRGDNRILVNDFVSFLSAHQMPIPEDLQRGPFKLLLVEDNPLDVKLFVKALEGRGFDIRHAENGFQAGALLGTFMPDVVCLDLNIPGLGGLDVIKMMRGQEQFKDVKILVISAMDKDQLNAARAAGADDVLQKPYGYQTLAEKIERFSPVESGSRFAKPRPSTGGL